MHGSGLKSRNNSGKMWNGLVTSLAAEMGNAHSEIEKKQKEALEKRSQLLNQRNKKGDKVDKAALEKDKEERRKENERKDLERKRAEKKAKREKGERKTHTEEGVDMGEGGG